MTNNAMRLIAIDIGRCVIKVNFSLIKRSKLLSFNCYLLSSVACFVLIGCSTTQPPVPVIDRAKTDLSGSMGKSTEASNLNNQFYVVQKGDTLYSIALNHGIDFKKLAEWNNIVDPKTIRPGQRLSLSTAVQDAQPTLFALTPQPVETTTEPTEQPSIAVSRESDTTKTNLKTSPKALKLAFTEQNIARLKDPATNLFPAQKSTSSPVAERNTRIEAAPQPEPQKSERTVKQPDAEWIWPTAGKLLSSFSKNSKGVKISGQPGQPVLASAAGEVVYSGHGLRGYGNLIIIKHNNTFLSAYAHNSKILVKEGETVTKGQKIAEMGNTDTDTVQLHFEIRKHGKPVDPMEYLPNQS
ncbi:MAG: peptidoglycan DD-metalloendopeptidase family protein [Nitrosomonas sp.]|nr:peptidoglycan DD-metalloendopeptidase family protein [Nitrosomonas sp.]MBP6076343.1 peptidoglycan DD-metalloendopeptidase family protein [Nitrosomonas sp.]